MRTVPYLEGLDANDIKEYHTICDYKSIPGSVRVAFGSKFWVNRLTRYRQMMLKHGDHASKSLSQLTASQDIWGKAIDGGAEHLLKILWHFEQTKNPADMGIMTWRAVRSIPIE